LIAGKNGACFSYAGFWLRFGFLAASIVRFSMIGKMI